MLHVSIKPEVVFFIQGFPITNSLLTSTIAVVFIFLLGLFFRANINSTSSKTVFFIRFVLLKLHETFEAILGSLHEKAFPLIVSFFFFILLSNWLGLLPGVGSVVITPPHKEVVETEVMHKETPVSEHAEEDVKESEEVHKIPLLRGATADLNMTLALAVIAFTAIQYYGFSALGLAYLKKFFNFSSPINFFIGILELVSEFSKILSFGFRLFGNIFAGEVLIGVIAFLIPILATFPFLLMEIFVGFIQAIVFSMLTGVFISSAVQSHDEH